MENQPNQDVKLHLKSHKSVFLITITLVSMAGLVGSDVLPMLPNLSEYFGKSHEEMQPC